MYTSLWFLLLLLLCMRALPLSSCCCPVGWLMLFPFPWLSGPVSRTQTLVGRGQSRSCRDGTFGCTMFSSSEYHGEATQKGYLNTENGPEVRAPRAEFV